MIHGFLYKFLVRFPQYINIYIYKLFNKRVWSFKCRSWVDFGRRIQILSFRFIDNMTQNSQSRCCNTEHLALWHELLSNFPFFFSIVLTLSTQVWCFLWCTRSFVIIYRYLEKSTSRDMYRLPFILFYFQLHFSRNFPSTSIHWRGISLSMNATKKQS